jgi:hypothetical protein
LKKNKLSKRVESHRQPLWIANWTAGEFSGFYDEPPIDRLPNYFSFQTLKANPSIKYHNHFFP